MPLACTRLACDVTAATRRHAVSRLGERKRRRVGHCLGTIAVLGERVYERGEQPFLWRKDVCGCVVTHRLCGSIREQVAGKESSHLINSSVPETVELYPVDAPGERSCNT
jgi:hypothetical protein